MDAVAQSQTTPAEPGNCRVVVVMPAYNAVRTLMDTYNAIPPGLAKEVILVDDKSQDATVDLAKTLPIKVIKHPHNTGYGGSQKTLYMEALRDGADIVAMLHPDFQYDPTALPDIIGPILSGKADIVFGSRVKEPGAALKGGMPIWKFIANRCLTWLENIVLGHKLTDAHSGYRAYSRKFLETIPFLRNSNDFVFDSQVIAQACYFGARMEEIPIPTRYFAEASSVGFKASVIYGFKTLGVLILFVLHRLRISRTRMLMP